jgi:hypothetical protein
MDHYHPQAEADPANPAPSGLGNASRVAGEYGSTRAAYTTMEAVTLLFGPATIRADGDAAIVFNSPLMSGRYVEVEPLLFRQEDGDDVLLFQEDSQGRIRYAFEHNFPIRALEKLAWYESPSLQLPVLAACLLLILGVLPIALVRRLRRSAAPSQGLARLVWPLAGVEAVLLLLFAIGFTLVFTNQFAFVSGDVALLRGVLALPFLMIVVLAALVLALLAAWRQGAGSVGARIYSTLVAVATAVFIGMLDFWNLLGWKF